MELEFDSKGHLKPYDKITVKLADFEDFFVKNFQNSLTRAKIFENYLRFIQDFQSEVTPNFTHWINGSFVTRKINPNDIDFVTLIDASIYEQKKALIEAKFKLLAAKAVYQVDAYTVNVFPQEDTRHNITKSELAYWQHWFSKTKKNRNRENFPKGFIEIIF